jgi:hypothetical protein
MKLKEEGRESGILIIGFGDGGGPASGEARIHQFRKLPRPRSPHKRRIEPHWFSVPGPRQFNPERIVSLSPALDRQGKRGGGPTLGKHRSRTINSERVASRPQKPPDRTGERCSCLPKSNHSAPPLRTNTDGLAAGAATDHRPTFSLHPSAFILFFGPAHCINARKNRAGSPSPVPVGSIERIVSLSPPRLSPLTPQPLEWPLSRLGGHGAKSSRNWEPVVGYLFILKTEGLRHLLGGPNPFPNGGFLFAGSRAIFGAWKTN